MLILEFIAYCIDACFVCDMRRRPLKLSFTKVATCCCILKSITRNQQWIIPLQSSSELILPACTCQPSKIPKSFNSIPIHLVPSSTTRFNTKTWRKIDTHDRVRRDGKPCFARDNSGQENLFHLQNDGGTDKHGINIAVYFQDHTARAVIWSHKSLPLADAWTPFCCIRLILFALRVLSSCPTLTFLSSTHNDRYI